MNYLQGLKKSLLGFYICIGAAQQAIEAAGLLSKEALGSFWPAMMYFLLIPLYLLIDSQYKKQLGPQPEKPFTSRRYVFIATAVILTIAVTPLLRQLLGVSIPLGSWLLALLFLIIWLYDRQQSFNLLTLVVLFSFIAVTTPLAVLPPLHDGLLGLTILVMGLIEHNKLMSQSKESVAAS
jgi:hypothetical protein